MATTGTTFPDQKNLEKQMGCMAGFLQLFNRHHLLTGKRVYSAKRLTPLPSIADFGQSTRSPSEDPNPATPPRSDRSNPQLDNSSIKTPPPSISPFGIKDGTTTGKRTSWKFREAPRLSLDSRATTDSNGTLHRKQIRTVNPSQSPENGTCAGDEIEKQRKSTSVIARLMGLEPLTTTSFTESSSSANSPQLRRSASESRVARDLTRISLESTINYRQKQIPVQKAMPKQELNPRPAKSEAMRTSYRRNVNQQQQQQSYYDSSDFFPGPKQSSVSVYGEIEKRLKTSGVVYGSSKDLETLKHVLEALQLKGLLHSNKASIDQNFVYERVNEPRIVVMKPSRSVESPPPSYRSMKPGLIPRRSNPNECPPAVIPQRRMRNSISPTRSESSVKSTSSSSVQGRRQFNVETHRSRNSSAEQGRVSSPVSSPKPAFRRSVESQTSSSPRSRRLVVDAHLKEKISLPLSDDSPSVGSDEHSKGKTLLSRCDMLLQCIADMNSTNSSEQPSPISVLDPSFYKEDESSSSSPSPIPKRSIDFKDLSIDFEDEDSSWTISAISTVNVSVSDHLDFLYVADVLRALASLPEESDIFPLLEKQLCKRGKDGANTSKLKRKLIFDNVIQILNKHKHLPPWKADLCVDTSSLPYVWSEFKKIREPDEPDQELLQVICGHLKKDLASDSFNSQNEVAESVLDIERMVFKDLIGEAIRDLASSAVLFYPRRKLAF